MPLAWFNLCEFSVGVILSIPETLTGSSAKNPDIPEELYRISRLKSDFFYVSCKPMIGSFLDSSKSVIFERMIVRYSSITAAIEKLQTKLFSSDSW